MRKSTEGWEVPVDESDTALGRKSTLQKISDNSIFFILVLISVVLFSGILIFRYVQAAQDEMETEGIVITGQEIGYYDDAEHSQFAIEFKADKSISLEILDAEFTGPGEFRFVVPGYSNTDDAEYVSKYVARKILAEFGSPSVILVYKREVNTGNETLLATTEWDPESYGFRTSIENMGSF